MIEVSLWLLVIVVEFVLVLVVVSVAIVLRANAVGARLRARITELQEELAASQIPVDLDHEIEEPVADEAPEVVGVTKLVLMSQADVDAAQRPTPEPGEGESIEELLKKLLEKTEAQTNHLNSVLERSASLGMKLGALHGTEGLDEETKSQIQLAIDHMRETDEVLVEAADQGMEVDETIRHAQTKVEEQCGGTGPVVDHVALNEILMARADGQTEEELEQLREEVRQRLLAEPSPGPDPEAQAKLAELDEEVDNLKTQLAQEKGEFSELQASLAEVTEEYQRLFEQFQPTA